MLPRRGRRTVCKGEGQGMGQWRNVAERVPGYRMALALRDLTRPGDRRAAALLRLRRPAGLFQPFGTTGVDRYPAIFGRLREALQPHPATHGDVPLRLLSFGCSTGEEVFTLRTYFPTATITGIDISAPRIAVARREVPARQQKTTRFVVAASAAGELPDSYDAVLAMAVFRHGDLADGPARIGAGLSFDRFETAVSQLAVRVRPGGYFAIRHANFRFADTAIADGFDAIMWDESITPHYDRSGLRLRHVATEPCLFRRRYDPDIASRPDDPVVG